MDTLKTSTIKRKIPNILSTFRIIGSLCLPFLALGSWEKDITILEMTFTRVPFIWIIAFIIIIITDKLDGTLARKFNVVSNLGALLDNIADVLVMGIGATICLVRFVDKLEPWQSLVYLIMVSIAVLSMVFTYILAKIYHGKGNMVHTYYHKIFTVCCCLSIIAWAFLRSIPAWTIYTLFAIMMILAIDESVYCVRTAKYDVNFKGHGFEKYEKREIVKK